MSAEITPFKLKPLTPSECRLAESVRNTWCATVPADMSREQAAASDTHCVVSHRYVPRDHIEIWWEDRSAYAELLVLEAGRGYASLVELSYTKLPSIVADASGIPPGFDVFHAGPDSLYCIKRIKDGVIMGKDFRTKDDALKFLLDHATLKGK